MPNANEEEVREDLEANDNNDDQGVSDSDDSQTSEEQTLSEDDGETISVNREEYAKLQREAAAAKRLRERKESNKEGSESSPQVIDQTLIEQVERLTLANAGLTNPDIQDEALRLAKKLHQPVHEIMRDPDIKRILASKQKSREAQRSVAGGTGGATTANKGLDYYVTQYKQKGILPEDSKLIAQIVDALAKK
jgi:hypothetical protein